MKTNFLRILSVVIASLLLVLNFTSCANQNESVAMEYKLNEKAVSQADISLFSLVTAIVNFQLGTNALTPEMWDMAYQEGNDTTVRDIVSAQAKAYLKGLLQAEYLCDYAYGIGMSDVQKDSVETYINALSQSFGSEKQLENYLSAYGTDVDALRQYMTLVIKQDTLYKSFYSEGGIRYEDVRAKKSAYFEENFHIADHILIKYSGELKDDGTEVPLTDEEKAQKLEEAKSLYNAVNAGLLDFDETLETYNEDTYKLGYPFGYFVPETFYWSGISPDVQDAVCEMNVGEIRFVNTDEGAYIIRKNEMNSALYASNGAFETYLESTLSQEDFLAECEKADGVVIHEEALSGIDASKIMPFDIDALGLQE